MAALKLEGRAGAGGDRLAVLHGGDAVAALKHCKETDLTYRCNGVLHGGDAVAALKQVQSGFQRAVAGVLHGGDAVAALKHLRDRACATEPALFSTAETP